MRTNTTNRNWQPVAMIAMAGVAMGLGTAAHAQLNEDNVLAQLEASTFTVTSDDEMTMYGVLRDFPSWHPDFALSPGVADGQYAGNTNYFADWDHKPAYSGQGSEVATQWRNKDGQPIAPHLAEFSNYGPWPENAGVYFTGSLTLSQSTFIDSYDSSAGSYILTRSNDGVIAMQATDTSAITVSSQGTTIGGTLLIGPGGDTTQTVDALTGPVVTMDAAPDLYKVLAPIALPAYQGDVLLSTTVTFSSNQHFGTLSMDANTDITIDGNIMIVCQGLFTMGKLSSIELTPGSTLEIYTLGGVQAVGQSGRINSVTKDPTLVNWYNLSNGAFDIAQNTKIYASIYAPGTIFTLASGSELFGRVQADAVNIDQASAIHIDRSLGLPIVSPCGIVIDDSLGTYSGGHLGGIWGAFTYYTWFRNIPGLNVTDVVRLPMKGDGTGTFEHTTADFTPADGQLFGNEGDTHNRNFTYEMTGVGMYSMCAGQFFEFTGDGDVWVMINDNLVIDLGGQGPGKHQVADIDRMGFSDGELFTMRFFYAQRTPGASPFSIRTNIDFVFSDSLKPESSGLYD